MGGYGQFCPVAKAMEILDERWTLLIARELLLGTRHFNDLRRGVPKMSPALLSKRLRSMERAGLVHRRPDGGRVAYELTAAGCDLLDIVNRVGLWGLRWFPDLGDDDLDPHLLMWDMRRALPAGAWPGGRTTVTVRFIDVDSRAARWWVVVTDGEVGVGDVDPGFPAEAGMRTSLRTLTGIWRGDLTWSRAIRSGDLVLEGPAQNRRRIPVWFGTSPLAQTARLHARAETSPALTPQRRREL